MAPNNNLGKRMKGVSVFRPIIYGTTAQKFDDKKNPKPPGTPDDHTHSWTVFVKGVDNTDITYWLKRVQFKLHESIPNHVRMVEGEYGKPFLVHETGWGEFEIAIKFYYVPESGEKAQTIYHHLRLHPYGRTEEEKEVQIKSGTIHSWNYEEATFGEPYEQFFDIFTSGPPAFPDAAAAVAWREKLNHVQNQGNPHVNANTLAKLEKDRPHGIKISEGGVVERTAMIPERAKLPDHPFARETEALEIKQLQEAQAKVEALIGTTGEQMKEREAYLMKLKAENGAVTAADSAATTKK